VAILLPLIQPPAELIDILLPAFKPCAAFQQTCRQYARWDPSEGHAPRGFRGATGLLEEVELILVCAEPGNPYLGETCEPPGGAPEDRLRMVYTASCRHLKEGADLFARNIRTILDMAWPGVSFELQMRRTWLTEAVLCSAPDEGGPVPSVVSKECRDRYLRRQLALFPRARIVALGGKAQRQLARCDVPFVSAWAASPPGCNRPAARESWKHSVANLRRAM
jgi:hypothetical protein